MVTILDASPLHRTNGERRPSTIRPTGVTVTDTTELRWFVEGQLPDAVASWFTLDGSKG